MWRWLMLAGLVVTALGAGIAAWSVIIDRQTAERLSATRWDSNTALRDAFIRQSRSAAIGLGLVVAGTLLQLVGTIVAP